MKIKITDLGAIGWVPDVDGFELPPNAWTEADNVRFRNGYVETMEGHVEVYSATRAVTTFAVQWLCQYSVGASTKYMIQVGTNAAYAVDSTGAATDITGTALTATEAARVTGGVMSGILGVNNGVDVPQYWAGNLASNLATFTGWDSGWRCKALRPFKNFWFALHVTKGATVYPHMVKWSHAADPGSVPSSWDATDASLDAGEQDLDGQDVLVDALAVGDQLWLFKERSIHTCTYIGAPLIWRFARLPGDVGLLSQNCAVQTPRGVVFLSASDVVLHNGQTWQSIVDGRARRWLFDNIDTTYADRSFVVSNPEFKEVWVCFPESGQSKCTKALIWNWETNTLSKADVPYIVHAEAMDMDMTNIDPWDWTIEAGVEPGVGAYEWEAYGDTWDKFDRLLGQKRVNLFMVTVYEFGGTYYSITLLADAGHVNYRDALDVTTTNLYFMVGTVERTGLSFSEEHRRFQVSTIWPRWGGDGITSTYMPVGALTATESPETASGLSSGVNLTENYVPQRYVGNQSGRYFHLRFDLSAAYPARLKTMHVELNQLGQY